MISFVNPLGLNTNEKTLTQTVSRKSLKRYIDLIFVSNIARFMKFAMHRFNRDTFSLLSGRRDRQLNNGDSSDTSGRIATLSMVEY